jgi:hypothetical protein
MKHVTLPEKRIDFRNLLTEAWMGVPLAIREQTERLRLGQRPSRLWDVMPWCPIRVVKATG